MSDYKITIDKTEDCPYLALTVWVCDKLNSKCVGLGCEGCPFQPMPSCETCGNRQKKKRLCFGSWRYPCDKFRRLVEPEFCCSAYTPEVKHE